MVSIEKEEDVKIIEEKTTTEVNEVGDSNEATET